MNYVIPANIETPYGELQKTKFWMIQGSPTTLVEGLAWYDSTAHLPKYYDGTSAKEFGRVYSAGTGISISNANVISFDNSVLSGYVQTDSDTSLSSLTLSNGGGITLDGGYISVESDVETGARGLAISAYDIQDEVDSPLVLYGSTLTFNGYDVITSETVGVADGIATLDSNGKVPTSQLPSFVDDVIEAYIRTGATALSSTWLSTTDGGGALTPETGKIYVILSSGTYQNKTYRWAGSTYVEISASPGAASTSEAGIIEIATQQEVNAGTDTQRAVTPADLNYYYQRKLVSGTNIKTINSTSLLGSGNINITEGTVKSADSNNKLYLVGAQSQSSSPQDSYSSSKVYVQGGYLYSTSTLPSNSSSDIVATTYWVKSLNYGTVKSVNGITPNSSGDVGVPVPQVNDSTVTIKVNNVSAGSFTLNSSSGQNVNITVPTNTSELTNDAGFLISQNLKTINGSSIVGAGTISVAKKYAADNPALTASGGVAEWSVTHNLLTKDVCVSVIKKSTNEAIFPAWKILGYNNIQISFLTSEDIAADTYRVVVMGVPNS